MTANGTSVSIGRAECITKSESRRWSGWMWSSLGAAEELPGPSAPWHGMPS